MRNREQEKFVTYNWSKKSVEVVDSGQPKISKLNCTVKGHQQILRLEVTVDDSMTVQEINTTEYLKHKILEEGNLIS